MGKRNQQDYEVSEKAEVTLQDFVIPSKIQAFCNQYKPQDHWTEDCDVFTDYQLRTYFKAVVCHTNARNKRVPEVCGRSTKKNVHTFSLPPPFLLP